MLLALSRGAASSAATAAAGAAASSSASASPFAGRARGRTGRRPAEINAWVVIKPDDTVVIRIARSEMGQGTLTGLAQLVAEELECDWANVTHRIPDAGPEPRAQPRVGQLLDRRQPRHPRIAGLRAQGRRHRARDAGSGGGRRLEGAGRRMQRRQRRHHARRRRGRTHDVTARSRAAAAKLTPPAEIALKDPKDLEDRRQAGQAPRHRATSSNGAQVYGIDLKLPGMLNAAIKDCPVFGGKVKSVRRRCGRETPGVKKVVAVGDSAVAVVADTWWHAKTALDALPIEWDEGAERQAVERDFAADAEGRPRRRAMRSSATRSGDVGPRSPARRATIEAVYSYPHQNHATMEPMNATARWTAERCEVWTPTQNGEAALAATAEASGLPSAKCDVHKIHLGGGFGRRGHDRLGAPGGG